MAEVRQFCRETWGKDWWDVAEDVKEARKRVAAGALGGEPADEATAALAGDVEAARAATKKAASKTAAASAAKAKRDAAEAEAEKRYDDAREVEWAAGGAAGVANAAAARLVENVQQARVGTASIRSSDGDAKRARVAVRVTQAGGRKMTIIVDAGSDHGGRRPCFYRRDGDVLLSDFEDDPVYPYDEFAMDDLLSEEG